MPRYIHPHSQVPWEWLYRATIYPPPLSSSMGLGVIYYATVCQLLCLVVWQDHDLDIFSLLTIIGEGVIISWKYILTPNNIWGVGNYIMTLFLHFWQYWGGDVIISWHYVFTLDNIWGGGDYIVALHFHPWQCLGGGWLYRGIIFPLPTILGEGVIISWHYIFTPDNIWGGGDCIVTLYFHSPRIWHWGWLRGRGGISVRR